MQLPEQFDKRMQTMLGGEYQAFVQSLNSTPHTALRLNTLKHATIKNINQFNITPVSWCSTGYYYHNSTPGKHPYHNAGMYYMQEPSAMAVAELADVQHGDMVLDLCAAPGGKSSHIACKLNGTGLLVANEIIPNRAKVLSENIERMGVRNCIVTNESPTALATKWGAIFDKVFVDAPCSGEGMFRKDNTAIQEWSDSSNTSCHIRQLDILAQADKLLKVGGKLIYSTCTFSPLENEGTILEFITTHTNYKIVQLKHSFDSGNCQYIDSDNTTLNNTVRIWPHHTMGEGHYIAVLQKLDGNDDTPKYNHTTANKKLISLFEQWQKQNLNITLYGKYCQFGDNLYLQPEINLDIDNIKVMRYGLHLGSANKGVFTPSHALAMATCAQDWQRVANISYDQAIQYLRGNTISNDIINGWCAVVLDGYILGLGKATNGTVKNHYPKGLRI